MFVNLLIALLVVYASTQTAWADVYMHNPRGSNDRNCERNVNRNNGNRLFDSQNNNNGGYACPRGVGDENFQSEAGQAVYKDNANKDDDATNNIRQNKRMYYYENSILPIEFTSQHGCGGNSKVACEIVLQYACEDTLDPLVDDFWPWVQNKAQNGTTFRGKQHFRSGSDIGAPRDGVPRDSDDAATDTIPDNVDNAIPDTKEDRRFGMQESFDYYQLCQRTERNRGIYTADQNLRRNDRRATRQNPNGNRHGFECPEERDYYPWWAPSPWIDVAVLTDSASNFTCSWANRDKCTTRCKYYVDNTMNWNAKGYCDVDHSNPTSDVNTKINNAAWQQNRWFNNKAACENAGFKWYGISHNDTISNLKDPDHSFICAHTQFSRTNQLGNAFNDDIYSQTALRTNGNVEDNVVRGVEANRFMWTIPKIPKAKYSAPSNFMEKSYKSCIFRIRYNISSADFPAWPDEAVDLNNRATYNMVTSKNNSKLTASGNVDYSNTPLYQDPYIYIGPGDYPKRGEKFVSLAVNTNQYARTFQDRSYVFSIKKFPTSDASQDEKSDSPSFDLITVKNNIANGGKIYNVNVRGKRGNIVQTFPSVEYDFVPNALSLSTVDMIHFQWTGSDYNPRRGCNDAEGGPPDLNTYSTDANANLNSRADRSNVVFMEHMANNVPRHYITYDPSVPLSDPPNAMWNERVENQTKAVLQFAPCFTSGNPIYSSTGLTSEAKQCLDTINWLSYLNQQSDGKSLSLRSGAKCLTQAELDAIPNQDVANNHPLNCAKMNAKPYPYFDGGIMFMKRSGWFPFYSTRNNNFSNRQQSGIICVAGGSTTCNLMPGTGVLQDQNPLVNGNSMPRQAVNLANSTCDPTAMGQKGSTSTGAMSCLTSSTNVTLAGETFTVQSGDNDNKGDGNRMGCPIYTESFLESLFAPGKKTVEQQVALAIILLFVGLISSWLAYYLYNRWRAKQSSFGLRDDKKWQEETSKEMKKEFKASTFELSKANDYSPVSPSNDLGDRGSGKYANTSPHGSQRLTSASRSQRPKSDIEPNPRSSQGRWSGTNSSPSARSSSPSSRATSSSRQTRGGVDMI